MQDDFDLFAEFPTLTPERQERNTLLPPAPRPAALDDPTPRVATERPTPTWEAAAAALRPRRCAGTTTPALGTRAR
jgi:hypothetical protein